MHVATHSVGQLGLIDARLTKPRKPLAQSLGCATADLVVPGIAVCFCCELLCALVVPGIAVCFCAQVWHQLLVHCSPGSTFVLVTSLTGTAGPCVRLAACKVDTMCGKPAMVCACNVC